MKAFGKYNKLIALSVALSWVLSSGFFALSVQAVEMQSPKLQIGDDIAGNSVVIKASNLKVGQDYQLKILKPDQNIITLVSRTDSAGQLNSKLADYHTKKSGNYTVKLLENDLLLASGGFKIWPDKTSTERSELSADQIILKADGLNRAMINVKLKDQYGNLVEGKDVKLISSRNDVIEDNDNGFMVASNNPGNSVLMAYDVTDDVLLANRVNLSFVEDSFFVADAGGDLIKTAYAAEVGPLSGFEISDLPLNVKPNENVTFKVKAIDDASQLVQDYSGTIRFSAEGENSSAVTLPANYKFLASDLGQHQFNLGLSFTQPGTYKIVVNDLADKFKKGEKTVVVAALGSSGNPSGSASGTVTLSSPAAGTYNQSVQTITGNAKANSLVSILDNNQEIGSVSVNITGKFSFQSPALKDGKHSIYLVNKDSITNEVIGNSTPVEIFVDTTAPKIDELKIDPASGIKAGSVINVKVYSEAKLSEAAMIFNSDIIPLNASIEDPSVYIGTVQAPSTPGAYGLNILLSDELTNEKTYENQATINVDPAGGTIENNSIDHTVKTDNINNTDSAPSEVVVPEKVGPAQVAGLIAYGSDKRITLVWEAAVSNKKVKNYKIYYGDVVSDLSKTMLTKDASSTWYIAGLENGKEYFFAVAAIDEDGNESVSRSEIVSGIPFMLEIKNALSDGPKESLPSPNLKPAAYGGPYPESQAKTGPEVLFLLGGSFGLAGLITKKSKKK